MEQAAGKQKMADNVHEIKTEINRVEHEAIRARQVLDQRLTGFERAGAWTDAHMAEEFSKW